MVQIITDSTACLNPEYASKYGISVIPQVINFGEESFYEGVNMSIKEFMDRLQSKNQTPKTAAPPPELFIEQFSRMSNQGQTILCIHPSSDISGTVRSAQIAAQDFPELDIRIIDTRVVASPLGSMVEHAAEWAADGIDADTIVTRLQDLSNRCRVYFLVASLDFLARGGRIGGAQALVGSILQIKPILCIHEGKVDRYESERTHKRALERLIEIVVSQIPHNGTGDLTVLHAGVQDEGRELAARLSKAIHQPYVRVVDMPPAIVTHAGPGILGAGFFIHGGIA